MRKCPKCNHQFSSARIRGPIVWGEQHVSFDQDTIQAVSPIVSHAVMKPGHEFKKIERVSMTCPSCDISLPVSQFIPVFVCPITGESENLMSVLIGGATVEVSQSVTAAMLYEINRWYGTAASTISSDTLVPLVDAMRGVGIGTLE